MLNEKKKIQCINMNNSYIIYIAINILSPLNMQMLRLAIYLTVCRWNLYTLTIRNYAVYVSIFAKPTAYVS